MASTINREMILGEHLPVADMMEEQWPFLGAGIMKSTEELMKEDRSCQSILPGRPRGIPNISRVLEAPAGIDWY